MGGYEAAAAAADQVEHTYAAIAELIGADPDEIAVIENATRAWDMAFYGLDFAAGRPDPHRAGRVRQQRDRVPPGRRPHRRGHRGRSTTTSPASVSVATSGDASATATAPVKLVAITHVPTQGGLVNPAEEIGAATREAGVPLPARRLPVGRADARRRRADRLRHALRDGTEVPPRALEGPGSSTSAASFLDQLEPPFLDLHAATWTAA